MWGNSLEFMLPILLLSPGATFSSKGSTFCSKWGSAMSNGALNGFVSGLAQEV